MSQLDNIDDIALSSAFPTDKIVKVLSGSFNASTSERQKDSSGFEIYSRLRVSHGQHRPVFTRLKWSLDGVNWVDGGSAQLKSNPLVQCITFSNSDEVVLLSTDLSSVIYYEIICFWIDDYDSTNPMVDSFFGYNTKPLAFDSRLNYQKILKQGELSLSGVGSVPHGLGRKPNAWVYFESNNGEVWPAIFGGAGNAWFYNYATQREIEYSISTTDLNLEIIGTTCRVWYIIYTEGS